MPFDLDLTCPHWRDTVEGLLSHSAATPDHLSRALESAPRFALAHALKGLLTLSLARRELYPAARGALADARAAHAEQAPEVRAEAFIQALALWLDDKPRAAAHSIEKAIARDPTDVLALKVSQIIRFMLGDQEEMLAAARIVARRTDEASPFAGFVHGCYAFALEERGFYREAEYAGRRAVAAQPRDVWGRHAVAHVLEMTGRAEEGVRWLADPSAYAHANNLRFHIAWHLALFRLERGETNEALRLYDEAIRAEATDDFRDIANGASLLAQLEFRGVDVGGRWEKLADCAQTRVEDRCLVFADLHYTLALVGAGRRRDAEAIGCALLVDERAHTSEERRTAARFGARAAFGLIALRDGDAAEAARLLGAARRGLVSIGGSEAQRDLFEQAWIESLIRSGDFMRATTALEDRLVRRGGVNSYAMRRLARLRTRPENRAATLLAAATPLAFAH